MNIAFRVDSSSEMGSGHLARCLSLASRLRDSGAHPVFFSKSLPGHFNEAISAAGFPLHTLPVEAGWQASGQGYRGWLHGSVEHDAQEFLRELIAVAGTEGAFQWVIVDHYGLDSTWEVRVRDQVANIGVIDDLADRPHSADWLLDVTFCEQMRSRYAGLVPASCALFLGPNYVFLRDEFAVASRMGGDARDILVFFGGVDQHSMTARVLDAVAPQLPDRQLQVVLGAGNPHTDSLVERWQDVGNVSLMRSVNNMAELLGRSCLCIGAGGVFTWERLHMRVPTIAFATEQNQVETLEALATGGYLAYLGRERGFDGQLLVRSVREHLDNKPDYREMRVGGGYDLLWQRLQGC